MARARLHVPIACVDWLNVSRRNLDLDLAGGDVRFQAVATGSWMAEMRRKQLCALHPDRAVRRFTKTLNRSISSFLTECRTENRFTRSLKLLHVR